MVQDAHEYIYATGSTDTAMIFKLDTITNWLNNDLFIGKYDSSGNAVWSTCAGGGFSDRGYSISLDNCNNLWISGATTNGSIMHFDAHIEFVPGGPDPAFVAEYSDSGKFKRCMMLPTGGDDYLGIFADRKGHFYLAGDYERMTLLLGPDTLLEPGMGCEALLIAKYGPTDCDASYVLPLAVNPGGIPAAGINLYPNPATDECIIYSDKAFLSGSHADVFNLTGRLVKTVPLSGYPSRFSVAELPPGLYQCRITLGDHNVITKKLAVLR